MSRAGRRELEVEQLEVEKELERHDHAPRLSIDDRRALARFGKALADVASLQALVEGASLLDLAHMREARRVGIAGGRSFRGLAGASPLEPVDLEEEEVAAQVADDRRRRAQRRREP